MGPTLKLESLAIPRPFCLLIFHPQASENGEDVKGDLKPVQDGILLGERTWAGLEPAPALPKIMG
jgi:hypothetical protein